MFYRYLLPFISFLSILPVLAANAPQQKSIEDTAVTTLALEKVNGWITAAQQKGEMGREQAAELANQLLIYKDGSQLEKAYQAYKLLSIKNFNLLNLAGKVAVATIWLTTLATGGVLLVPQATKLLPNFLANHAFLIRGILVWLFFFCVGFITNLLVFSALRGLALAFNPIQPKDRLFAYIKSKGVRWLSSDSFSVNSWVEFKLFLISLVAWPTAIGLAMAIRKLVPSWETKLPYIGVAYPASFLLCFAPLVVAAKLDWL